ncbi:BT_3928 family protein [Sediminicola luteus]|uniref:DoxX family protein n=1 Tax=Sediminicola luteus TaxID=319238 RepID=A0A2A4G8R6_9FLAO|nr:BT_3928 family protein [Sediminicola luteus]PCE64378.1 DoxX family protein [Sediminicola luteus]
MRYLVGVSRVFVGVLFIISGLIKLNDPLGFSFKLEEYFSAQVLDIPFLEPHALALSIFVVIFEVVLGVFLLLGFQKKFTLWSLLGMIVFFTFLTFYSAYFNKVTDCGCFGDAVKLTPWESFGKDVILLVLILILVKGQAYIKPFLPAKLEKGIVVASLLGCAFFAYHVLNHLPSVDFRPYKIGANIEAGMSIPEGAPEPVFEYTWTFKEADGEKSYVTNGAYPESPGEFVGVETKEIQKGYEPPIHDFTMEEDGEDKTSVFMAEEKLLVVISYDMAKSEQAAFAEVGQLAKKARAAGYKVIGLSASGENLTGTVTQSTGIPFYFTDQTALKTIVRSNPGILVLEKGTIVQKVHYNDIDHINLN